jgi:hypothetical protein
LSEYAEVVKWNSPKALANFSPGFEPCENPGLLPKSRFNPERIRRGRNPFRVRMNLVDVIPGLSLRSNPGLRLANAFGVVNANAFGVFN